MNQPRASYTIIIVFRSVGGTCAERYITDQDGPWSRDQAMLWSLDQRNQPPGPAGVWRYESHGFRVTSIPRPVKMTHAERRRVRQAERGGKIKPHANRKTLVASGGPALVRTTTNGE